MWNRFIKSHIFGRKCLSESVLLSRSFNEEPLRIPRRIPRGPTDVLQALASTVKVDYTAPSYKYHDDPFFIPSSASSKRNFALAKESGKKAARFFLNKYPESFKNDPAEPQVAAFNPPSKVFVEGQDNTLEDLSYCIDNLHVGDAQIVFNNLQTKGITVPQKDIRSLLELVSFYNGHETIDEELYEERWFRYSQSSGRKTWQDGGLAELLFEMIEQKDVQAYGALIQGMAKHMQTEKAYFLYQEMRSKEMSPSVHTYNYLISSVVFLRDGSNQRYELLLELLSDMNRCGVRPTVVTFNSVLFVCSRLGSLVTAKHCALQTLAEMRNVGIRPSLATYSFLLNVFCKDKGPVSYILSDIMELIGGQNFDIRDIRDIEFFATAMKVCHNHLMDLDLAFKVHELLESNHHLMGNAMRESAYYQHFFKLLCAAMPLDRFMFFYEKFVPNLYTPDFGVIGDILQAIGDNRAWHFLPQIWSDIIIFGYDKRESIVSLVLKTAALFRLPETAATMSDNETQGRLLATARDIRDRIVQFQEQQSGAPFRAPFRLSAQDLSYMLQIFLNGNQLEDAWRVVQQVVEGQKNVVGFPNIEPLREFVRASFNANRYDRAMVCAKYCSEIGYQDIVEWMYKQAEENQLEEVKSKLEELSASLT